MSQQLKNMIQTIAEDPDVLDQFKSDPEAVMNDHKLSEEHKQLVRDGDKDQIQKESGASDAHMNFLIV